MNDNIILIIFICISIIFFFFYFRFAKEQKKFLNMYARKNGSDSYEEMMQKLVDNPLKAPFYTMSKSFSIIALPFKKTKDQEINLQASKVRKAIYRLIFIFFTLAVILVCYALLYSYTLHTGGKN